MKYAIPLGTILLVAAVAALHRATPQPAAERMKQDGRRSITQEPAEGGLVASPKREIVASRSETPSVQATAQPAMLPKPIRPSSWRKMTAVVELGVGLTPLQRSSVEELLKEREEQIKSCHDSIVRSGVIDIPHYEWQVDRMRDEWYRRIDALLDRDQHERFVGLVQKGFLNEGLAFTIEPGMTVLD